MNIVILGLSITSSWGNGHATTYRALVRALALRGHDVLFLERDAEWYAGNRDLPNPPYCRTRLYDAVSQLADRHTSDIQSADLVVIGSYVPEGIAVADLVQRTAHGVTAFYDIDTPVTLARLERGDADYISRDQIPHYDLYLSFTGGPTLERLCDEYGARLPCALYCSVDPDLYYPERATPAYDLAYLGTYSDDRQPVLEQLMLESARMWSGGRFVVAGPQYPESIAWPHNVTRLTHLAPAQHRYFYNQTRYTLNVTRRDMIRAGYSPSVRLFEAAACGTPIISDDWAGLETLFTPGADILISRGPSETLAYLRDIPESDREEIGLRGRRRVLTAHTAMHRAAELESFVRAARHAPVAPDPSAARMVETRRS
jgi:spore maturation protein CgeB